MGSTADLLPGDVAIWAVLPGDNFGHTFIYIGVQPGFEDDTASSSMDSRAPMAYPENVLNSKATWFRKM